MFPLGRVLLPHMALPLHVFEPRYRDMVRDLLDDGRYGHGRFGVVLIERGHEVGGGEQRSDAGTVAEIVHAEELDDGRWLLVAVGRRRLRVERWLPDDPYPRAVVELLDDPPADAGDAALRDRVARKLEGVLTLAAAVDGAEPEPLDAVATDPLEASYQLSVLAPIGPADAERLLRSPTAGERLTRLDGMLDEQSEILEFRTRQ